MSDDPVEFSHGGQSPAILREIADLLRERVALEVRKQEMREEQSRKSEERFAEITKEMPKLSVPDLPAFGGEAFKERMQRADEQMEEDRVRRRNFEERLLGEMERHNRLLEEILSRLADGR